MQLKQQIKPLSQNDALQSPTSPQLNRQTQNMAGLYNPSSDTRLKSETVSCSCKHLLDAPLKRNITSVDVEDAESETDFSSPKIGEENLHTWTSVRSLKSTLSHFVAAVTGEAEMHAGIPSCPTQATPALMCTCSAHFVVHIQALLEYVGTDTLMIRGIMLTVIPPRWFIF